MTASMSQRRLVLLKRMATLCTLLILAIAGISAYIRLSGAGLGCPDWPQCYGSNLRQAQQGIDTKAGASPATVGVRMVHRVVAVAALLLIIVMAMACFSSKLRREAWMALALLALALLLAVLGRWSGSARLPAVAIGNLLGGFTMLALSWRLRQALAARIGGEDTAGASSQDAPPIRMRGLAWLALIVLTCQIALGGLVSAGFAGLSCAGLPSCGGNASSARISLEALDPWREPVFAEVATPPANPPGVPAHMAHRYGAIAVLLTLLPLGLAARRAGRRQAALMLLTLLVIGIWLGLLLVALSLPLGAALAHNLGAALLLVAVASVI